MQVWRGILLIVDRFDFVVLSSIGRRECGGSVEGYEADHDREASDGERLAAGFSGGVYSSGISFRR